MFNDEKIEVELTPEEIEELLKDISHIIKNRETKDHERAPKKVT